MAGMVCPSCGSATSTVDSRPSRHGAVTKRRRECTVCEKRFTTYEVPEELYRRLEDAPADYTMRALRRIRDEATRAMNGRAASG